MAANTPLTVAWEPRLLRWANLGLEASVLYLVLAAWARPRTGPTGWLPLAACLALAAGLGTRRLLESTTVGEQLRWLATGLAALAWALLAAQLVAPAGYWQADAPRLALLSGAVFGAREGSALQPLAFWSSLLLWWRGHTVGDWEPTLDEALSRLKIGGVAVAAAVGLAAAADRTEGLLSVQVEQMLGVGVFLSAALTMTALSRRREMAGGMTPGPAVEDPRTGSRRQSWLIAGLVIATALAVLALAVLGTGLLTPETLAPILGLGGMLVQGVLGLLGALAALLASLWSQVQLPSAPPPPVEPAPASLAEPPGERLVPPAALGWIFSLLWIAGGLALLVLLGSALVRMLSRISFSEVRGVEADDQEDELRGVSPTEPATILARLLRLFRFFWSPRTAGAARVGLRTARPAEAVEPGSVRAAYREYLLWCAQRGHRRRTDETPDELRERVAAIYPEVTAEVGLLTSLYVASRYAGRTCSPDELRQAQRALRRLASLAREAADSIADRPSDTGTAG